MDWMQILIVFAIVFSNLATVIGLYLHLDNKTSIQIREMRSMIDSYLRAIADDMKDFHGRLLTLEDRYLRLRERE